MRRGLTLITALFAALFMLAPGAIAAPGGLNGDAPPAQPSVADCVFVRGVTTCTYVTYGAWTAQDDETQVVADTSCASGQMNQARTVEKRDVFTQVVKHHGAPISKGKLISDTGVVKTGEQTRYGDWTDTGCVPETGGGNGGPCGPDSNASQNACEGAENGGQGGGANSGATNSGGGNGGGGANNGGGPNK